MNTTIPIIPESVIDFINSAPFLIDSKKELLASIFIPDSELLFRISDMLSYPLALHYIAPAINKYESEICISSSALKKRLSLTPCVTAESPLLITLPGS